MSKNNDHKQFFPDDELDRERIIEEVPVDPKYLDQERIPSGYDPMSEIYLRGRAYRGLAEGRIPWWVIISGWIIFGGSALLILISVIASADFKLLSASLLSPSVIFSILVAVLTFSIPLIIMWRGTVAKLSIEKHKKKRRR